MRKRPARTRPLAKSGAKALAFDSAGVSWDFMLPGTNFNYPRETGDGLKSSVVVAALNWIMRAFPEAPAVTEKYDNEQWRMVPNHDLAALLRQPNPFYSGRVLWMATAMDFCFGEAFWLKVRDGMGKLVELWWVPRALITPKWDLADPTSFITHYDYSVGGQPKRIEVKDVVHFRFGMDPSNIRRGFSQLAAIFREVYIDDQASNFTASILRNLGIVGLIFSPDGVNIPPGQLETFKKYVQENFTGDKRGNTMAFSQPMKTQLLQYNLQGFDVGPIRDISEERVCASLGIPAAVIGFGTGLQQTKVGATMREMIQLAWRGSIMPSQEIIADELDRSVLPEFQKNTDLFRVKFDTTQVRALWEDEQQRSNRILEAMSKGAVTVAEYRRAMGYEVRPEHEVYYRPINIEAVSKPTDPPQPAQVRVTDTGAPGATPTLSPAEPDKATTSVEEAA